MPGEAIPKKGTNQFMRQGQTEGCYGNDPSDGARGHAGEAPRELKP